MEDRYNVECCDFIHAHEEIVEKVRDKIPGADFIVSEDIQKEIRCISARQWPL